MWEAAAEQLRLREVERLARSEEAMEEAIRHFHGNFDCNFAMRDDC